MINRKEIWKESTKCESTCDHWGREGRGITIKYFEHPNPDENFYTEEEVKAMFDKFDQYACVKDDKWYKEYKKEVLK